MTDPAPQIDLPQMAARVLGTHLLIDPSKAAILMGVLGPKLFGGKGALDIRGAAAEGGRDLLEPRVSFLTDDVYRGLRARPGEGYSNIQGVAVLPVLGTLVRRGAWTGAFSGMTSYEGVSAQLRAAVDDPQVRAIALEIDSFGGEAMGVFDLARDIRAAREVKPVWAFVSHYALSGGYAIAAQATRIVAPELAKVGSIGVVMMHADHSRQLDGEGVTVTLIHSGARKVDGNPYEPLPEAVRAARQAEGDRLWLRFAEEVEAGRNGAIKAADVLRTEAGVFEAAEAKRLGLIDRVADLREAFAELAGTEPAPLRRAGARAQAESFAASGLKILGLMPAEQISSGSLTLAQGSSGCEPGAVAPSPKESGMSHIDTQAPDADQPKAPKTAAGAAPDAGKAREEGAAEVTARSAKILDKCEKAGLSLAFARGLIADGVSLEVAYDRIIDAKAAKAQDGGDIVNASGRITITGDGVDRTREGMTKALSARAGLKDGERNEFTGMSLRELARATLAARGLTAPTGGSLQLVGAAFVPSMAGGMHGTSDFGNILADIANKSMLKGFEEAEETFEMFTSVGTMTDFKPHKKVGLDAFPGLEKVEAGAEFKFGTMGDHGETALLATYGRLFAITRQAIINDDMDAFTTVPLKMGRAARRTVGDLVFAVLTGNPNMSDGNPLFHGASHGNRAGSVAPPSELAINAAITAMMRQTDRSENARQLNISPKYLIAPPDLRAQVLHSLRSDHAPDDTDKAGSAKQPRAYNTVKDAAEPIFDARIAANGGWFLVADPVRFDTIEVEYLDGVSTPFIDQQDGWTVDGIEMKVRLDAAATPLAWEGMYWTPGA